MPFPNVDSRIISPDEDVAVLESNGVGELVIKSPSIMKGYHNMPTETANTVRDGWLYTGDIAYMDDDGYFYIVDRKKEMIKPGGFQDWCRDRLAPFKIPTQIEFRDELPKTTVGKILRRELVRQDKEKVDAESEG